jgi:predicted nucleotidyltransferase
MEINVVLKSLKDIISECIGQERLQGVMLFGSEARSTATMTSDIDIMVLLKGPINYGQDLWNIISATYTIQLEIERCLHFILADIEEYNSGEFSLYRIIKNEGIAA